MKKYCPLLLSVFLFSIACGNQIDIGIFESSTVQNQAEIKLRPDFYISSTQTITNILFTVRWSDPAITISTQFIPPFFIFPQGEPVLYNGYYYQVFGAVPMIVFEMNAYQEYLVSAFSITNGDCSAFEIIEDEWTFLNNGDVYLELLGQMSPE